MFLLSKVDKRGSFFWAKKGKVVKMAVNLIEKVIEVRNFLKFWIIKKIIMSKKNMGRFLILMKLGWKNCLFYKT